ncbi:hypothetical protein [Streptomyces griseoviridis]|uniref:Uncharacterized protein n=1 Tax=Streptomyces griseoviridis TaxID=45398 RepID=A0ABT9LGI0_STRGD|nr:hypothetical protein [Streptomyces griseoviridis]MDP9682355.1 hypothetical protein [Streptomyces griseoviridis]GGS82066.1 hypothetical protein GCM10010240_14310 [Streptomyces griseoviridis]
MPKVQKQTNFLQELAELREQVAALQRAGREVDEVPFYPTVYWGLVWEDNTVFTTYWETILTPRAARLDLGLVGIGDQVGGVSSGGEWQVLLDGVVSATGNVPASFTYVFPALSFDLAPYRTASSLKVQIQARRTAGATTGGQQGGGGSIGLSPRYARLL